MAELLTYIIPTFAGIIASEYLGRLANFILMIIVFQIDLGVLMGHLGAGLFTPYTVLCIIPALVGIVGDRYLGKCNYDLQIGSRYFLIGKIVNVLLILAMFWLGPCRTFLFTSVDGGIRVTLHSLGSEGHQTKICDTSAARSFWS